MYIDGIWPGLFLPGMDWQPLHHHTFLSRTKQDKEDMAWILHGPWHEELRRLHRAEWCVSNIELRNMT